MVRVPIITTPKEAVGLQLPLATTNTTVPATAGVVNRDARWTYSYLNSVTPAAGTYGGVNVNNGRATYTAVTP